MRTTPIHGVLSPQDTTFGYVGYDPSVNSIVVAFRGTDTVSDWITDVDFILKPFFNYTDVEAHEVFMPFLSLSLSLSLSRSRCSHREQSHTSSTPS